MSRLKEKMKAYRELKELTYTKYNSVLNHNQTFLIASDKENNYHIVSPSLYETGSLQLTCFIDSKPYNHATYSSIKEMIYDDPSTFINGYIKEAI